MSLEREGVAKRIAANELVRRAIALFPDQARSHNYPAGDFLPAKRLIETALDIDPSNPQTHWMMCLVLAVMRDIERALPQCRSVTSLFPEDARAHTMLGEVLFLKGDFENAIAEYRIAVQLDPNSGPYQGLGLALLKARKMEEAENAFHHAIRLDPNNVESHANLGLLLGFKRNWAGALAEYKTAVGLDPDKPETHYNLGLFYMFKAGRLHHEGVAQEQQIAEASREASREMREFLRLVPNTSANWENIETARLALSKLEHGLFRERP